MSSAKYLYKRTVKEGYNCAYKVMLITIFISLFLTGCNTTSEDLVDSNTRASVTINKNINIVKRQPAQILLNNQISLLSGWNHVQEFPEAFNALSFSKALYHTHQDKIKDNDKRYYASTLIKKIDDWHQQHANGITAQFPDIRFENIAGLEVVLRVNSKTSHIPNYTQLHKTFSQWVNEQDLKKLDDRNVYLSFALVGSQAVKKEGTFNAAFLLTLNVETQVDQWLHIFIPNSQLALYNEINYNEIPLSKNKANLNSVSRFRLMAETKSTQVVRNLIPDNFDESVPQLLKEVGVELKYIGIVKSSQDKAD